MLEIKNLYKSFGDKAVIKDLSFSLEKRGLYAVTGKSGCGKTTLFNMILGLLPCDSGSIACKAEKTRAVFQEDRLLEHKTPVENLVFVGATQGNTGVGVHIYNRIHGQLLILRTLCTSDGDPPW